jgi:hypothetical protein
MLIWQQNHEMQHDDEQIEMEKMGYCSRNPVLSPTYRCHNVRQLNSNIFLRGMFESGAVKPHTFKAPLGHLPWIRSHFREISNLAYLILTSQCITRPI